MFVHRLCSLLLCVERYKGHKITERDVNLFAIVCVKFLGKNIGVRQVRRLKGGVRRSGSRVWFFFLNVFELFHF